MNIRDKIKQLERQIENAKYELEDLYAAELIEQFGENASCKNCKYGCVIESSMYGNYCLKGYKAKSLCKEYKNDNKLSSYIRTISRDCFRLKDISDGIEMLFDEDYIDDERLADKIISIINIAEGK